MFKNYFNTAWRSLLGNMAFSFINISGLALGMTCTLLIFLWMEDERRFDQSVPGAAQTYVVYEDLVSEGVPDPGYWTPGLLASELRRNVPEIKYATGFWDRDAVTSVFEAREKIIPFDHTCYADSDFFKVFNYPLLEGTAATALAGTDDMAISRDMAERFFGSPEAAFGKTIRYNDSHDFRVSAVFDNQPANVSHQFEYLLNWNSLIDSVRWMLDWIYRGPNTFIRLQPHADPVKVEAKIKYFLSTYLANSNVGPGHRATLGLQPFDEMYLHSVFRNGKPTGGKIEYLELFSVAAMFVLLIACINFMNLATAWSFRRSKEVGVRKTIGATSSTLFSQFIWEALVMSVLAVVLALVMSTVLLPFFNQLTNKQIRIPFSSTGFWAGLGGFTLLTGFIAGSYPAVFLSSLSPLKVLKGALQFSSRSLLFRRGLVVFQFVLSIMLINATIIVSRQVDYLYTKNLGFDKENLVYMPFQGDLITKYQIYKQKLSRMPGIQGVTRSLQAPSHIGSHVYEISWDGKNPNSHIVAMHNGVGYEYLKVMNLQLLQGRDFSREFPTDSAGYILNEMAAKMTGYKEPIGKNLDFFGIHGHIIGVVKDFHLGSLHDPIKPLILWLGEAWPTRWGGVMLLKTKPGKTREAIASMKTVFQEIEPKFPFRYFFADEEYQRLYDNERTISQLSDGFSFLAILISCLGLLGLAMFTAEQRRKEIGIRKVIGASVASLVGMLAKDIVKLIMLAAVIASPFAWVAMNIWLQNYAYRIDISWWIFFLAAVIALLIALLTISYQALRSALGNPVKILRTE